MDLSKLISQEQQAAPQLPTYTKEEYAAQKQAEREALWQHVDELTASTFMDGASLQGFLDFTAHCNRQRTANLLLLYDQEPTITMARSFDAWQQAGRPVRAGEIGYTALIGQDYEREDGKTGHGYRIGKMFDVTQTRGRPLPEPGHHETEELIAALVETSPVGLRLSDQLPDQVQAQYVPAQRAIFVRNGMDATITFCLLTRELAHAEFARMPGYRRRDFAAQAYCAAYVLAQKYGVAAQNFQFDQIVAEYTGREPQTQRQFLSDVKIAAYTVSRQMDRALREDLEHGMAGDYEFTASADKPPKRAAKQSERG